jgi:hypothetical protein
MQVNTVNVELSIAKSHYVGYTHVTIYKTLLQCQNLNYFTLKSSIQNEWTLNKNDLCRFDSQFSIESKNEIKLGRFHLKKHNFSVFIILGHPIYIPQYFPNM